MTAYRIDLRVDDPYPILDWISENVPREHVIRDIAYKIPDGWYMKIAFDNPKIVDELESVWGGERVNLRPNVPPSE